MTTGTLRCRIEKNGAAWHAVEIQGNGSLSNAAIFEEPNKYICEVGDKIDVYLDLDGVTSSGLIDAMFRVCIVPE